MDTYGSNPPGSYWEDTDQALPKDYHTENPDLTRVRDVMTPAVIEVDEEMPLADLVRLMQKRKVHRVIVTNGGRLRGIVTSMDLLRVLGRLLHEKGR